ncbi:MAG: peptide ABC transporter substrate-binding protein [Oscillibacter sp.]|nr:peptide ABC transporter substrate-binding protein [Oscillibacter sp.]
MKKSLALLLALCMALSLAACGGGGGGTAAPVSDENAQSVAASPGAMAVCLASEPDTIDPALNSSVDGATLIIHLFSGLAKWAQTDDGSLTIAPDAAEELTEGVTNDDGTVTYTYTLREGLQWSDGQPVTAADFVYAWNRAASVELAADYNYMFEVVQGYNDIWEADDDGNPVNPDAKLSVEALDERTLQVTLYNAVSYWNELLAFPAYMPVREDVVSDESWATKPESLVCNGPYTITSWTHDSLITMEKNPNYIDADSVTMEKLEFYLSDDENNMLSNFQNGSWQFIDDVPTNEISALKEEYPAQFVVTGQIGTYYVCWNINEDILPASSGLVGAEAENARAEIRQAVALLFDRNYIVNDIAQGGQLPASSFVAMGMTEPDNSEFYKNAGHNDAFVGYYDVSEDSIESNYSAAVETLKKYYAFDEASQTFTDFPTLTYLYNTNEGHKAIAEYLQSALAGVGITVNLENQEWKTFLNTRKTGDYSIARNGWLADYNDPICFLDMWTTDSGNNDVQFGRGDHASVIAYGVDLRNVGIPDDIHPVAAWPDNAYDHGTWAETYDVLISAIKTCTDNDTRYKLMHAAEDLLMSTGCIAPLYFYTDLYMISDSVTGFYSNPLGFKYFMNCTVEAYG